MSTLQDKAVVKVLMERRKATWCQRIIDDGIMCSTKLLYDVQTEEARAAAWSGTCNRNSQEKRGFFPESEKKTTLLGFDLSLSSEYTRALNFIKSKMEDNYRD